MVQGEKDSRGAEGGIPVIAFEQYIHCIWVGALLLGYKAQ